MHALGGVFGMPSRARFRGHEHDGIHLCAVIEGGFVEKAGRSWVDVGPGTVRISSAARHDIDFSESGAQCLLLLPAVAGLGVRSQPQFLSPDPWLTALAGRLAYRMAHTSALEIDEASDEF